MVKTTSSAIPSSFSAVTADVALKKWFLHDIDRASEMDEILA